ncbi:assembly protein [Vibrio gigantis]|uniref:zonular occludens toxin domain-containing protein n=1 Tax=Vibrio gigantis TaxID=296199 RepID=UPI002FC6E029
MIYCIAGRPRSGKSYESVAFHIIPAIKAGRKVVTNVTLNVPYFQKVFGNDVLKLIEVVDGKLNEYGSMDRPFSKLEDYVTDWRDADNKGPLFVIDEAHMVLPNKQLDSKILEFYSLHGHYGIDIILLTQNLRKIHKDVRDMVEMTYYCAKNTAFGSKNTYTKKVRIGATTEVVNEEQRKYKKSFFPFYQSHTQSSGSVAEAMSNDIKPIWHRWPFWMGGTLIICGIIFNIYAWSGGDEELEPVLKSEQNNVVDSAQVSVPDGVPGKTTKTVKKSSGFGPLDEFDLFVTGYARQTAWHDVTKNLVDFQNSFVRIYIEVRQNDSKLFTFSQSELIEMGYGFKVLADCVYRVTWGDSVKTLTCVESRDDNRVNDPFDFSKAVKI